MLEVRNTPGLTGYSKESACSAGDPSLIPGSGRSRGEGNSNPLHYSCLGNPMDRGAWQATVHGAAKSQTKLSIWLFIGEEEAWGEAGLSKVTEVSGKATPGGEAP